MSLPSSTLSPEISSTFPSPDAADERRAFPRRSAKGAVVCRPRGAPRDDAIDATPVNVSENGILLLLPAALASGAEIELDFLDSRGSNVTALAVVRTVARREFGRWQIGCQFLRPLTRDQLGALPS